MTVDEIKDREIQNLKRKRVNPTDFITDDEIKAREIQSQK